jgi:hypothetical protein
MSEHQVLKSYDLNCIAKKSELTKRMEYPHPQPHPTWDQSSSDAMYPSNTTDGTVDPPWDTNRPDIVLYASLEFLPEITATVGTVRLV